jgi:hypothetical protein
MVNNKPIPKNQIEFSTNINPMRKIIPSNIIVIDNSIGCFLDCARGAPLSG